MCGATVVVMLETASINILEIRFRKNLAKLTGSAVRINSKKLKGKKTMKGKKNLGEATPGFESAPQLTPANKSAAFDHSAMRPLHQSEVVKLIFLKYLSLPFTLFEPILVPRATRHNL